MGVVWLRGKGSASAARWDDVALALEFLEASAAARREAAARMRRLLDLQGAIPPTMRRAIPCTRPAGTYVLLPWPMASWLAHVLTRPDGVVQEVSSRLTGWLRGGSSGSARQEARGEGWTGDY
jgi:hypothetical protein